LPFNEYNIQTKSKIKMVEIKSVAIVGVGFFNPTFTILN
jgi:hypothetical protein